MPASFRARTGLQLESPQFFPFLNALRRKILKFPRTVARSFPMVAQSGSTKRPTCPSCSKPTRICLCNRFQTPALHNSVAVTVLQHSLEKKHPLNSTRIATIGLKNVDVVTVSDVNFQARFLIRLLCSCSVMGRVKLGEASHLFDEMVSEGANNTFGGRTILQCSEAGAGDVSSDGQNNERSDLSGAERNRICENVTTLSGNCASDEAMLNENGEVINAISFTIGRYGSISSFRHCGIPPEKCPEMSLDQLLASEMAVDYIRKGFVVKKLGTKLLEGSNEYEEKEEFEVSVPPGSVLLFPSERSADVEALNLEVKNLIVLDGTWAKAKRMYNENPWLRLLPHIRLDVDKLSLYSEVRHQPRAEYLSTIESIVYAMKAVGEDSEGLDGLLNVFESMVGDQRRCKNDRLSKSSEK